MSISVTLARLEPNRVSLAQNKETSSSYKSSEQYDQLIAAVNPALDHFAATLQHVRVGTCDRILRSRRFLGAIDPAFALAGLRRLLLTSLGLTANLIRLERRLLFVELVALLVILVFTSGLYLLYVWSLKVQARRNHMHDFECNSTEIT